MISEFPLWLKLILNDLQKANADVADYFGGKYKVTKNEGIREEKFYDCCKEPYISLKYTLGLTRMPKHQACKKEL